MSRHSVSVSTPFWTTVGLAVVGAFLVSCASGEPKAGLDPNDPSPIVQLLLSPPSATVATDGSVSFSATALHADSSLSVPSITWSATGGSITQGGVYTPGTVVGTYAVTADLVGSSLSQSAPVTIVAVTSPIVSLSVSPGTANLSTGGTQQFSVTATRQDGSTLTPSVTWSATGGSITGAGLYTAGSTAGAFRVIAVQQGGTLADTSIVNLAAPVLQAVILRPSNASVVTGGTRQFSVTGQWSDGSTTAPAVTYAATGGTITTGGLYTAGSTTGSYRVIATQQGGMLADTSSVTVSAAPPSSMYFNSSEPGGDGSNPNYLMADDFEDGDWYSKNCDDANNSGGLLQTDGWCGTIYANPITPAGAVSPLGTGFRGSSYAANGGYHTGGAGARNMASHGFRGGVTNLEEAYFRSYFQPQADYVGGHEKLFDFTQDVESAQIVVLCDNYFSSMTLRCIPLLHQDDGVQGQATAWMGSNMAPTVTLIPTHWYYFEMHAKLNTPGVHDGVFEWWLNDCGTNGLGCTGTPTLRGRYTNVMYRDSGSESGVQIGGIWVENWGNPASVGTLYYDNVIASRSFIGYAP